MATIRIDNVLLSRMLFGLENELSITSVSMYETGPNGFIEFSVKGNPDLLGEAKEIKMVYQTVPTIVKHIMVKVS